MLKFLIAIFTFMFVTIGGVYAYLSMGLFVYTGWTYPVRVNFRAEGASIQKKTQDGVFEPILLRGVEVTSFIPGHTTWIFDASSDDYLRWFNYIYEMGANTVYAADILNDQFYNALYVFNTTSGNTLFLLQGVSPKYYGYEYFVSAARQAVDIIHGRRMELFNPTGMEFYFRDVSPWVVGFIIGVEWDIDHIAYINHSIAKPEYFYGSYFSTAYGSSRFEALLARTMESTLQHMTRRYNRQFPISFISSPEVDFLEYDINYVIQLRKHVQLDHENIIATPEVLAGTFAAYRLFYFADSFADILTPRQQLEIFPILNSLNRACMFNGYLDLLARYHTMPVIAAGFTFSSARAAVRMDVPPLNERLKGQNLALLNRQIETMGWAGSFISTWQDNWERRTWNTAFSSNITRNQHWHDLQTYFQNTGLLSFDPGNEQRPVILDGIAEEWDETHRIHEHAGISIYAQYSAQGLYLLVRGVNPVETFYLPIDVTPRSGSSTAFYRLEFERPSDFILVLSGYYDTRLLVTQRFNATHQRFHSEKTGANPFAFAPPRWYSEFEPIMLALQNTTLINWDIMLHHPELRREAQLLRSWEAGLLTHGTGDPGSLFFNSHTDFSFGDDLVEIRLPWMMLNFYDPSTMQIHDDHYDNFGVEGLSIRSIYIGAGQGGFIPMSQIPLRGWRNNVEFHERLKQSYFIMQEAWRR